MESNLFISFTRVIKSSNDRFSKKKVFIDKHWKVVKVANSRFFFLCEIFLDARKSLYLKEKMRWCLVRKENGFNRFLFPSVMEVLEQNSPVKSLLFRRCKKSTVVDQKSLLGWFCERVQIGGGNHKSLMSHKVVTKIPVSSLHFGAYVC